MRRILIATFVALTACSSGTSTLHLALNSDDSAPTPFSGGETLATAQHVTVTVDQVDVHLSDGDAEVSRPDGGEEDEVRGEDVSDTDTRWQVVSRTPTQVDLMTIRDGLTQSIGDITLPSGKITQVRLKLHADADAGSGDDRITGAVVDASGQTCDLIVPHSATDPGVKINGVFKAARVTGGDYKVVVNLRLANSEKLTESTPCAYRLSPVIELKDVHHESQQEAADDHHGGGESEHADAGHS